MRESKGCLYTRVVQSSLRHHLRLPRASDIWLLGYEMATLTFKMFCIFCCASSPRVSKRLNIHTCMNG